MITVKRLKEIIKDMPDDIEIYIRNSHNPCGTIGELENVEKTFYGFFGEDIPCLVLNTQYTPKELKWVEGKEYEEFVDYEENDGKYH